MIDHFGLTFLFAENDVRVPTSRFADDTTIFTLRRPAGCQGNSSCIRAGFFPHNLFPRFGSWPVFEPHAIIHHIVGGASEMGVQHAEPVVGVKPSRGPRQRLDRYDEDDFDGYEDAMRAIGLWMVDEHEHALGVGQHHALGHHAQHHDRRLQSSSQRPLRTQRP